tara:strand:- start:8 stop:289 length:282 start_codon:yes stop_codon:yes gene_type:complete
MKIMVKISKVIRDLLIKNNKAKFNHTKASEELAELTTVLLQRVNKGAGVSDDKINEELAHALIRINVLVKVYGKKNIQKEINKKEQHLYNKYK